MVVVVALMAFVATLIGGVVAARLSGRRHLVLGLAGGVMLGVVFFDLLPVAVEQSGRPFGGPPAGMLTAVAGFLGVYAVERALSLHAGTHGHLDGHDHGPQPIGVAAAGGLVLHSLLDGVGIGVAFQGGAAVGVPVAIAVISHDFADGFNTFTLADLSRGTRTTAFVLLGLDATAPVVGAALGTAISVPPDAIALYLGFFAGVLLYIATGNVLPEAHARSARATVLLTVIGAAAMWFVVTWSSPAG
jgi:ZIP family zinc transporter